MCANPAWLLGVQEVVLAFVCCCNVNSRERYAKQCRHRMGMRDSRNSTHPSSSPGVGGQTAPATRTPTPVIFIPANIMLACRTLVSITPVTCCMPNSSCISSIPRVTHFPVSSMSVSRVVVSPVSICRLKTARLCSLIHSRMRCQGGLCFRVPRCTSV